MVKQFQEGEVYRNAKLGRDVMVFGVGIDTPTEVVLAVGWIDRVSEEMTDNGELTVNKSDFGDWEVVNL